LLDDLSLLHLIVGADCGGKAYCEARRTLCPRTHASPSCLVFVHLTHLEDIPETSPALHGESFGAMLIFVTWPLYALVTLFRDKEMYYVVGLTIDANAHAHVANAMPVVGSEIWLHYGQTVWCLRTLILLLERAFFLLGPEGV